MLEHQATSLYEAYQKKIIYQQRINKLQEELDYAKRILNDALNGPIFKDKPIGYEQEEHGYIFKIAKYFHTPYLKVETTIYEE